MLISLIALIISIILYYLAPDKYSYGYCVLLTIFFILSSIRIIQNVTINRNFFNFHTLFIISFFFVNFVYPVFLYPNSPFYFSVFKKDFNHDVITKATALALIGSCSYNLGVSLFYKRDYEYATIKDTNPGTILFLLTNWLYLVFILLILFAGKEMFQGNFGSTLHIPTGLLVIFQISLSLAVLLVILTRSYSNSFLGLIRKFNIGILLLLFVYILLFIYTGDRGPVIQIVIFTLGAFTFLVKPMKFRRFILIVIAGMLILTFVSYARSKNATATDQKGISGFVERGIKNMKINSFFDLGMDLIVCNRNLYAGFDYVNRNGINYGKSMSYYVFSPIPFLPTLMTRLFFYSDPVNLTTASIITKEAKATYGLGTNIIADLYMAFGIVGVIVFMLLLGIIVINFERKAYFSRRMNYIIAYLLLLGFSVYLARTSILFPLRYILWAILLYELFKRFRILLIKFASRNNIIQNQ